MKKFVAPFLVFLLVLFMGYYYVHMKPRFTHWLGELFPGAEISCGLVFPVPFVNTIYANDVQIYRKGPDPETPALFLYCDRLVHSRESETTGPDGTVTPVLSLQTKKIAGKTPFLDFSADNLTFNWYRSRTGKPEKEGETKEPAEKITFSSLEAKNLKIEGPRGATTAINNLSGKDWTFVPVEWQDGVVLLKENPWLFLLSRNSVIGQMELQGVAVPPKDETAPSFFSKINIKGESSPDKLDFAFQAFSETLIPASEDDASAPEAPNAGMVLDNLSRLSAISVEALIPWRQGGPRGESITELTMRYSLPLVIDVAISGASPAPSMQEAATWLAACAQQEPPFLSTPSVCLHDAGFERLNVTITDKGIREKLNNYFSGTGNILFLLEYEGRHGFASAFLALAHAVFERVQLTPELSAGAVLDDVDGPLYPFRENLSRRLEERKVLLQPSTGYTRKPLTERIAPFEMDEGVPFIPAAPSLPERMPQESDGQALPDASPVPQGRLPDALPVPQADGLPEAVPAKAPSGAVRPPGAVPSHSVVNPPQAPGLNRVHPSSAPPEAAEPAGATRQTSGKKKQRRQEESQPVGVPMRILPPWAL